MALPIRPRGCGEVCRELHVRPRREGDEDGVDDDVVEKVEHEEVGGGEHTRLIGRGGGCVQQPEVGHGELVTGGDEGWYWMGSALIDQ